LSYLAYVAANCCNALANMKEVDAKRIGVVGHSYGGKWAMFASCMYEKFACGVWSDPGIVFDETRPNVNYWEPWYLGEEAGRKRKPGVVTPENPRTGAYKTLFETGHDLHELHALMAPRPFLVSGGSEDPPERWRALNHSVAVNRLLGQTNRVAMTNRPHHTPTPESNEILYEFFVHFSK
jgi:pimeloyl-ACP methyl ester carboxylesterase